MNSRYITCYRKKNNKITIYISDGTKYTGIIRKRYINIDYYCNDWLFRIFNIDKWELTEKLPYKYFCGGWPECNDPKGAIDLLRALIKETKIRYYESTEL